VKEDTTTYVLSTASLNECIDETNFISAFFTSSSKFVTNTVTQSTVVVTKTVYVDITTTTTTIISNKTTNIAGPVVVLPPVDTYVPAAKGVNVLRGARAYESSFLNSAGIAATGALMLDGNTEGDFFKGSCWHTNNGDTNMFWGADMGSEKRIKQVNVYQRTDCCQVYAENYIITIGNNENVRLNP
jgi:hypothetical protein